MKALVWDDKLDRKRGTDDLSALVKELTNICKIHIDLKLVKKTTEFLKALNSGTHYDFFIIDWFDDLGMSNPLRGAKVVQVKGKTLFPAGEVLVTNIRRRFPSAPIFIYSNLPTRIRQEAMSLGLIFLKHKSSPISWVAFDILETLRVLHIMVDPKKVFVIYGHDREAKGATSILTQFLKARGLDPLLVDGSASAGPILLELLSQMQECAAFISVCTPDDHVVSASKAKGEIWQPRQNVLLELGVACGLCRNTDRVIILQKWSKVGKHLRAELPTDWDGYLKLRFSKSIKESFRHLEKRLCKLGLPVGSSKRKK